MKSSKERRSEMDMRYWIPAGAEEEKETNFLTDETQRTQSQANMRYWIPAGVAYSI